MAKIETTVREGQDNEDRVFLSCEVWETRDDGEYAEVVYSSHKDEYEVVFGVINDEMYNAAVAAIRGYAA